MEIYGNNHIKDIFQNMLKKEKMAHSFLLYGEKGLGKKTIADYFAMMLVCESDYKPCGMCRACRNAENHQHPDIIYAEHTGKLNGFSVETIRNLRADSYIKPNNSDKKVYILSDADNIGVQAQNALLKLIEEPPSYAYYIFTASEKNIFLETILSRVISLSVSEVSREDVYSALDKNNTDRETVMEAINCFGGNIGMCLEYINNDKLKNQVELTKKITDCIINRDEYGLLKLFTVAAEDRNTFKSILSMLDKIIRDAFALKYSKSIISCYSKGAEVLASSVSMNSCEKIHYLLNESSLLTDRNVNIKLISASLCGQIAEVR